MRGAGGTREALRACLPGEHAVDCGSRFEGPVHAKVEQWIFGTGLSATVFYQQTHEKKSKKRVLKGQAKGLIPH